MLFYIANQKTFYFLFEKIILSPKHDGDKSCAKSNVWRDLGPGKWSPVALLARITQ